MIVGKRKQQRAAQWWENLNAGDPLVLTYTDQFVGYPIGSVGHFVSREGGGLKVECPDSKQYIFSDQHWTRYTSEEQRSEIIARWNA